jgi:hypothetical protein
MLRAKSFNILSTCVGALAGVLISSAVAQASVVNVNFDTGPVHVINGTSWSASVAPRSYTGTTWTDTGSYASGTNLPDSNNNPTAVDYTITSGAISTYQGEASVPVIFKGGVYAFAPATLTLSDLDNDKKYDLYLVSNYFNQYGGTFALAGYPTQTTTADTMPGTYTEGDNYVKFLQISPTGGSIVVTETVAPGDALLVLNGFQLSVPEPASAGVACVAGLAMLRRRRV